MRNGRPRRASGPRHPGRALGSRSLLGIDAFGHTSPQWEVNQLNAGATNRRLQQGLPAEGTRSASRLRTPVEEPTKPVASEEPTWRADDRREDGFRIRSPLQYRGRLLWPDDTRQAGGGQYCSSVGRGQYANLGHE